MPGGTIAIGVSDASTKISSRRSADLSRDDVPYVAASNAIARRIRGGARRDIRIAARRARRARAILAQEKCDPPSVGMCSRSPAAVDGAEPAQ
jgi:hypothetical protein